MTFEEALVAAVDAAPDSDIANRLLEMLEEHRHRCCRPTVKLVEGRLVDLVEEAGGDQQRTSGEAGG